eukprot:CAMPEP_0197673552 /NCGR_PEP_ID=MMETSP1338-20131121/81176_1 /TAXON_ID=43686 ORGANISM="Pelagodinium beii, Strain RCC1491" /NCGR_SAMPLE_ID=MMETSP1338 /ASSEMBLY_ACC=CAM_ASM_000754 /LENGTH=384 /DNA_ID=CAMNT_0043253819 /DNA_START=40 /DNA_END=1194 /DNA_ORIENTATION=+
MEIRSKQPLAFLYLRTEDGLEGVGQLGRSQMDSVHGDNDLVTQVFMRHVAPIALGAEVTTPASLVELESKITDLNYKNTGQYFARAMSGLDTAAWDLMSKAAGTSVCQLAASEFGRDPQVCLRTYPIYCTNLTRDVSKEQLVDLIRGLHTKFGARSYKFKISTTMGHNVDVWPNRTEMVIPFVRQQVDKYLGPNISLTVDANGGYDPAHAQHIAGLLQEHGYEWFEEPVPFWNYQGTKTMHDLGFVKIAAGENEYRAEVLEMAVLAGTVNIVQPDLGYIGGFSNALHLAKAAATVKVLVDPHSPDLSMTEFFSLHLLLAVPNPGPFLEYGCTDESTPTDVFEQGIQVVNGRTALPPGPGWGVKVRDSWLKDAASTRYPPTLIHV